jgi:hypothetical protein
LENATEWKLMWKKSKATRISKQPSPNTDDRLKIQPEENFSYLGSMLNFERSKREIKSRIFMENPGLSWLIQDCHGKSRIIMENQGLSW